MDETETVLRQLTDTSAFETLAALYLEWRWPELRGIVQTGINAQGKAVASPIDALRIIPVGNATQRLAFLAATTTSEEELPRKWLGEDQIARAGKKRKREPKIGDVQKAAEELARWKQSHPQAHGVLYLATNRRPNADLVRRVSAQSHDLGLDSVEFIEASALLRFLNFNADGQYVRETILGLPADRLSDDLLAAICSESLVAHANHFPSTHADDWTIERDLTSELVNLLIQPGPCRIGLQGPSGFGKSVLLRQVGEAVLHFGGFALWIPAEGLQRGQTPSAVILQVLRQYRPRLNDGAGAEALRLAAARPGGLSLLIDDINHLSRPDNALEVICGLSEASDDCRWIVPLWPSQLRGNDDQAAGMTGTAPTQASWLTLNVIRYSPAERQRLATWVPIGLSSIVDGDPFLCSLLPPDVQFGLGPTRPELLRQILDSYVERSLQDAAAQRRVIGSAADFATTLDRLVAFVLQTDTPEPAWTTIRAELGEAGSDRLMLLAERSRIGWVETGSAGHWHWSHDRLRDMIIGRWLAHHILTEERDLTDVERGWLAHPGLAEAWALAGAYLKKGTDRQRAMQRFRQYQPLVLAKALQMGLFPAHPHERDIIRQGVTELFANAKSRGYTIVGDEASAALWALAQTDDPLVLQIVPEANTGIWDLTARFRTGDINAGLLFIHGMSRHHFLPAVRFGYFEAALAAFRRVFETKREGLVQVVRDAIGDDANTARSVLILGGYLAWPEWVPLASDLWRQMPSDEKEQSLAETIWALARCCTDDSIPELEEAVLIAYQRVQREEQHIKDSGRTLLVEGRLPHEQFRFVWSRWSMSPPAVRKFASLFRDHPDKADVLRGFVFELDSPDTVEAVLRSAPPVFLGESIDPLSNRRKKEPFPRNPETRDRLWQLFVTEKDPSVRRRVFALWREAASVTDLPRLQQIPNDDPLFDTVLAVRLRLRDRSAASLLVDHMNAAPSEWCAFAPAVFSEPGVAVAFETNLKAAFDGNGWRIPDYFPLHLEPDQVRAMIERKGDVLQQHPGVWPALWRSDVPEAIHFVQQQVAASSLKAVEHFFIHGEWPYPVSRRMLDGLTPVLDRFSPQEVTMSLGVAALRVGHRDWVLEHVVSRLPGSGRGPWLDRATVHEMLDRAAAAVPDGEMAIARNGLLPILHQHGDRLFDSTTELLRDWLGSRKPRPEQLIVAALVLERIGSGTDWGWWQTVVVAADQIDLFERVGWLLRRRRWQPILHADS